jgi:hypothetical protein
MGIIFTALFGINLFVTLQTIPVMEEFKTKSDDRQACISKHALQNTTIETY